MNACQPEKKKLRVLRQCRCVTAGVPQLHDAAFRNATAKSESLAEH